MSRHCSLVASNSKRFHQIWDRSFEEMKGFRGCGCIWLPSEPGVHSLDANVWLPTSEGLGALKETFLPVYPDLKAIRELSISPFLRSQFTCQKSGLVRVNINTMCNGFDQFGVRFSDPVPCLE